VLWCVAAHCSVVQCVAVCCSVSQNLPTLARKPAYHSSVSATTVAACCSVLQRVAACCSMLQRVAACCSILRGVAAFCSTCIALLRQSGDLLGEEHFLFRAEIQQATRNILKRIPTHDELVDILKSHNHDVTITTSQSRRHNHDVTITTSQSRRHNHDVTITTFARVSPIILFHQRRTDIVPSEAH